MRGMQPRRFQYLFFFFKCKKIQNSEDAGSLDDLKQVVRPVGLLGIDFPEKMISITTCFLGKSPSRPLVCCGRKLQECVFFCSVEGNGVVFKKYIYLLFCFVTSIYKPMRVAFRKSLESSIVHCRLCDAVDAVRYRRKRKNIRIW